MGTTATAIQGGNPQLAYVLCIEGYKYLITNDSASAAVTAWSGTLWSDALTGLEVEGSFKQSVAPWTQELVVPRITFSVTPEHGNDQFGVDMFKSKPSIRSELTAGFDTGDSSGGGFNIPVQDADQFSTGTVYVGNEAFNVTSSPSGTNIPVATNGEGYYSPFSTNVGSANRFPLPHNLPSTTTVNSYDTAQPVYATDTPTSWLGRKVALYVHRISGGTWDTKAQAQLWFAGIIDNISEGSNGETVLECEGLQKLIADSNILEDQWVARPKPGYKFQDGQWFGMVYSSFNNSSSPWEAGALTCTTGATGDDQFEPGYYTAPEIAAIIANWLDNDTTIGQSGSSKSLRWSSYVASDPVGMRFKCMAYESAAVQSSISMTASDGSMLEFLGFTNINHGEERVATTGSINNNGNYAKLISQDAPYHIFPIKAGNYHRDHRPAAVELEESDGSYVEHTTLLPPEAKEHVNGSESWSYFSIGDDVIFLARKDSDTALSGIHTDVSLAKKNKESPDVVAPGIRMQKDNAQSSVLIKQLFVASDSLSNMITKLFASIDGNGANHATYDVFPFGAAIPWSLLGDNFTDSLANLEQASAQDAMCLVIEKPTKLWEAIRCEFILRMAALVWKDGGLQVAEFTVPNAVTADHTLDETNKTDSTRTVTETTSEFVANTLKIEYNRDPLSGKYMDTLIVRDQAGYEAAGRVAKTKTIKARNSYSSILKTGAAVEALGQMIAARFLPTLAKPLKRWRRSISHQQFHMAPGDTVALTDNYIRNPSTGTRGISARACTVLSVGHQFGIASSSDYFGEVDLLFTEEDRLFTVCPSADHADVTVGSFVSGWRAGNRRLLTHQSHFSQAADSTTDAGYFTVGDAVRVYERDPSTPGSEDFFSDTLDAVDIAHVTSGMVDYDALQLTNGFGIGGRPAFDSTKLYTVTFDDYSTVGTSQQSNAYQADDADGFILDTIEPNLMGDDKPLLGFDAEAGTSLPSRYAGSQYGDGQAMSADVVRDAVRMANNLAHYKTAPHTPVMVDATEVVCSTSSATEYRVIWTFFLYLGQPMFTGGRERLLHIAPQFRSGSGGTTAYCRITSSANPPNLSTTSWTSVEFKGPKQQLTFSTSSSTSWSIGTADTLTPVRSEQWPDGTFITVEGGDLCAFKGLHELWLGPWS